MERARRGIEYMTVFPALVRDDSSTLRELSVLAFVTAASSLLAGGHHRVVMDNLGCVFITGGLVPPFAVGGKRFGEFVSGGLPNWVFPPPSSTDRGGGPHARLRRVRQHHRPGNAVGGMVVRTRTPSGARSGRGRPPPPRARQRLPQAACAVARRRRAGRFAIVT